MGYDEKVLYGKHSSKPRNRNIADTMKPQHFYQFLLKSRNHCHGMGAWATADMRGGARLKGGVSALSVRSGATRKRSEAGSVCLRTKALRNMTLMHLERPCGWPIMSA